MTCKQDNTTLTQIACCRGGNAFLLMVDILVYIFVNNNNNQKKNQGERVKCKIDSAAFPYLSVSEVIFLCQTWKTLSFGLPLLVLIISGILDTFFLCIGKCFLPIPPPSNSPIRLFGNFAIIKESRTKNTFPSSELVIGSFCYSLGSPTYSHGT